MKDRKRQLPNKPENYLRVADEIEAAFPRFRGPTLWHPDFGYVLQNGVVTLAGEAYYKRLAREATRKDLP